MDNWYRESSAYNYDTEPKSVEGIGNFTQVVWHMTRELGVAKFKRQDGNGCRVVVVCFYYPAGNVVSFFRANVPPPRSSSSAAQGALDTKRTSVQVTYLAIGTLSHSLTNTCLIFHIVTLTVLYT